LLLTPSGQQLLVTANEVLASWNSGLELIERLKNHHIRLGIESSISERYFPIIAKKLLDKKLLNELEVEEEGSKVLINMLNDGTVDLALIGSVEDSNNNKLQMEKLNEFHFNIWARKKHPLASKELISWQDIFQYNFITLNDSYLSHEVFNNIMVDSQPKVTFQSDNTDLVLQLIRNNDDLGFVSDLIGEHEDIVPMKFQNKIFPTAYISLAYCKDQVMTNELKTLMDVIRDVCQ